MLKYVVEFIGTFIFLSVIMATAGKSVLAPLLIGLALTTAIAFGGDISGGHFNPAVLTMMALNKSLPMSDLLPYIIVQLLGGATAQYFSALVRA